jgi:hypothetical protein
MGAIRRMASTDRRCSLAADNAPIRIAAAVNGLHIPTSQLPRLILAKGAPLSEFVDAFRLSTGGLNAIEHVSDALP